MVGEGQKNMPRRVLLALGMDQWGGGGIGIFLNGPILIIIFRIVKTYLQQNIRNRIMKIILKISLPLLIICSCGLWNPLSRNVVPVPINVVHIFNKLAALCEYRVGSYWIYHNDSLDLDDTFKIVKYEQYLYEMDSLNTFEQVDMTYHESYPNRQFVDGVGGFYVRQYYDPYDDYLTPQADIVFGFSTLDSTAYAPTKGDSVEMLLNYSSNAILYDTVYKIKSILHQNPSIYDENYIAPRKGIVEIVRTHDSSKVVWLLKSSKIVQ